MSLFQLVDLPQKERAVRLSLAVLEGEQDAWQTLQRRSQHLGEGGSPACRPSVFFKPEISEMTL